VSLDLAGVDWTQVARITNMTTTLQALTGAVGTVDFVDMAASVGSIVTTVADMPTVLTLAQALSTDLATVQTLVSGLEGVDLQPVDLSALDRIETQLGTVADPAGAATFFGQLTAVQRQLGAVGADAADAAGSAATAKSAAGSTSTSVSALREAIEAGNLESAWQILQSVRESMRTTQENVDQIPQLVKLASLYDEMGSMAQSIEQLAASRGYDYLINLGGAPEGEGAAAGAVGPTLDAQTVGKLSTAAQDLEGWTRFIGKVVDELQYKIVVDEQVIFLRP
jgi:hypothetical protein